MTECGKSLVEWASNSQLNCEWVTLMDEKALNFHRPRAPEVGLLMALPETSTWSRARQRDSGPQPLRTATWPWGLPGLSGASDNSVRRENESLKVALKAFQAVDAGRGVALLSFPEQFGSTVGVRPPSPWDLIEVREWANKLHLRRYSCYQCKLAPCSSSRPTGLLANMPLKLGNIATGWPRLTERPDGTWSYRGPLPPRCGCENHPPRIEGPSAPWEREPLSKLLDLLRPRFGFDQRIAGQPRKGEGEDAVTRRAEDSSEGDTTEPEPAPCEVKVVASCRQRDQDLTKELQLEAPRPLTG